MRKTNLLAAPLLIAALALAGCQTPPQNPPAEQQLSEAQKRALALKQEGFVESAEGWEFSASEKLLFGSDEAVLNQEAKQTVNRIARMLIDLGIPGVRIDGHTDASGSASYNDQLSLRRAQAVADVIAAAGMPADNIKVRGLGSRVPVASNQTAEGRSQNRRVVLVILGERP